MLKSKDISNDSFVNFISRISMRVLNEELNGDALYYYFFERCDEDESRNMVTFDYLNSMGPGDEINIWGIYNNKDFIFNVMVDDDDMFVMELTNTNEPVEFSDYTADGIIEQMRDIMHTRATGEFNAEYVDESLFIDKLTKITAKVLNESKICNIKK